MRDKPLLIYDGDCGFCRLWIRRWRQITGPRVAYAPSQAVAGRFPEIPPEAFQRSVQLVEEDGSVLEGAEAVFRSLAHAGGRRRAWLWLYRRLPGFKPVTEAAYAFIAARRSFFLRVTRLFWGRSARLQGFQLSRWIFLRLLGICWLAAFAAAWAQAEGLWGSRGILPAEDLLRDARTALGGAAPWRLPSAFWMTGGSDAALNAVCAAGTALAVLLILDLLPALCLAALWALYLSLSSVGGVFLGYQWDALLLETSLLSLLLVPWKARPGPSWEGPVPVWGRRLLWWLFFKLLLSSGAVKLLSGDAAWRALAALDYHYYTQPLPVWAAWYAHHLPPWFQRLSVALMFAVELGAPWLIFAPRRLRHLGAAAVAGLMALIAFTGNYCFFNLLTVALCVLLIDDAVWRRLWPRRWLPAPVSMEAMGTVPGRLTRALRPGLTAAALVFMTLPLLGAVFGGLPRPLAALSGLVAPLRSFNAYGLFAVMTTRRPEIIVEGSLDGREWRAYEFKWKPGDPAARPRFAAPYQPRLDWQMWFAALADYRAPNNRWFFPFLARLLEGSEPVLGLLAENPFPDRPPRRVRALYYEYRFASPEERRKTGSWWTRELKGLYCPVVSLR